MERKRINGYFDTNLYFPRQKLPTKQLSVHLFFNDALVFSFCFLLYESCLLGHLLVLKMNVLPGVKAEAAPGFTASVGLMITGLLSPISHLWHTHTQRKRKFPLFAHRSECFNEHHLQRQLQEERSATKVNEACVSKLCVPTFLLRDSKQGCPIIRQSHLLPVLMQNLL